MGCRSGKRRSENRRNDRKGLSMKKLLVCLIVLGLSGPVSALVCPAGQHVQCTGGSGRGGGYHSTCTCVTNPPPPCQTPWGTYVYDGYGIYSYSVTGTAWPDTCSNYQTTSICTAGAFDVPPAAYASCTSGCNPDEGCQD